MPSPESDRIAAEVLAASADRRQIAPFTTRQVGFDLGAAYRVTAALRRARIARGERPVGRKIGFTNRTIWPEYGVYAPIWGDMYDSTLRDLAATDGTLDLAPLLEPRNHIAAGDLASWLARLRSFNIERYRDDVLTDHGHALNVLDGPLSTISHLLNVLAENKENLPLHAGEIITTGTVTRAFPVAAGETWQTRVSGLPLDALKLRFN